MCVSQAHELGRHRGCISESGVFMNTEALSFIDHVATNSTVSEGPGDDKMSAPEKDTAVGIMPIVLQIWSRVKRDSR
jgi:hypothetical protein